MILLFRERQYVDVVDRRLHEAQNQQLLGSFSCPAVLASESYINLAVLLELYLRLGSSGSGCQIKCVLNAFSLNKTPSGQPLIFYNSPSQKQ